MKKIIPVIVALLILNFASGQNTSLNGIWTECFGFDSVKVFQCDKGYKTYHVDSSGKYILEDSTFCFPVKYPITGRWEIIKDKLIIYHDMNICITKYPANKYDIIWISSDLFYSTYISQVEAPGQKSFTVFKKLK